MCVVVGGHRGGRVGDWQGSCSRDWHAGESAVQTTSHHRQRAKKMSEQNVLAEAGDENSFLAAPSQSFRFPAASSDGGISH